MANQTLTIKAPSWVAKITQTPQEYINGLLRNFAFMRMQEYKQQKEMFENKYQMSFEKFEEKLNSLKKEDFEMWNDYLEWRVIDSAYKKWLQRYQEF